MIQKIQNELEMSKIMSSCPHAVKQITSQIEKERNKNGAYQVLLLFLELYIMIKLRQLLCLNFAQEV